jgi:A/G-specific adenine glycosylase
VLPWREVGADGRRDAWRSLVSEVMLQQTQVSRVVERFAEFIMRFPDAPAMAAADEKDVLALWAGMGYYRRARNLHACARAIVELHGGAVPGDPETLRRLPGIGRYTAGALASMVFGAPEATVDGNIARVLLRVDGRDLTAEEGVRWAWKRAHELVPAARDQGISAGVLNEGLMELGATVCVPRAPRCGECPLRPACRGAAAGKQERIPRPKIRAAQQLLWCAAVVLDDGAGRVLVERRSDDGMWPGLWQVLTLEGPGADGAMTESEVRVALGTAKPARLERVGDFVHATTHRDVRFVVWRGRIKAQGVLRALKRRKGALWMPWGELVDLGISSAQRRVVALARVQSTL